VTGKQRKYIYFYDNMNTNATWSEMSSLVYADKKKCPLLTKQLEYLKIKNEKGLITVTKSKETRNNILA